MLRAIRTRLSYANVMATIAVFVALGGVGYAAATLPRDSVGTTQVVNDSLRSTDIRNNDVRGIDIRDKTITGRDIQVGAIGAREVAGLTADDFAKGAIAPGPPGPQGPPGAAGAKGDKGSAGAKGEDGVGLTVKTAGGASLGRLLAATRIAGSAIEPGQPQLTLLAADGGIWTYQSSGVLMPDIVRPAFLNSDCSGPAYLRSLVLTAAELRAAYGPTFRLVWRPTSNGGATWGAAKVWKATTSGATTPGVTMYSYQTALGACGSDGLYTGTLLELSSVTPPPDAQGPLAVE